MHHAHNMHLALYVTLLAVVLPLCARGAGQTLSDAVLTKYLSNEELAAWGDEYAHRCSSIAIKFSIGTSAGGVELWGLEISDKPGVAEPEPNFKYVANMHGNEPSGRVLLPALANWLCDNYKTDERARRLVEDVHLFILPTMNPDGFAARTRENKAGVDLNRNFPDPIKQAGTDLTKPLPNAAPEVVAIMKWSQAHRFMASANLHEGAIVANYPFDGHPDGGEDLKPVNNPTPDDATFQHLAKAYAAAHAFMSDSKEFPHGITNGAHWYPVYGGMQDWNYVVRNCFGITLELFEQKYRPEADLSKLWEENKDALLQLPLVAALGGVRGWVSDPDGKPLAATLVLDGIAHNTSSDETFGYFARPLAPGTYSMTAMAPGYSPQKQDIRVPADGTGVVVTFNLTAPTGAGADAGLLVLNPKLTAGGPRLLYIMGAVFCMAGLIVVLALAQHRVLRGAGWQPLAVNGARPNSMV